MVDSKVMKTKFSYLCKDKHVGAFCLDEKKNITFSNIFLHF